MVPLAEHLSMVRYFFKKKAKILWCIVRNATTAKPGSFYRSLKSFALQPSPHLRECMQPRTPLILHQYSIPIFDIPISFKNPSAVRRIERLRISKYLFRQIFLHGLSHSPRSCDLFPENIFDLLSDPGFIQIYGKNIFVGQNAFQLIFEAG